MGEESHIVDLDLLAPGRRSPLRPKSAEPRRRPRSVRGSRDPSPASGRTAGTPLSGHQKRGGEGVRPHFGEPIALGDATQRSRTPVVQQRVRVLVGEGETLLERRLLPVRDDEGSDSRFDQRDAGDSVRKVSPLRCGCPRLRGSPRCRGAGRRRARGDASRGSLPCSPCLTAFHFVSGAGNRYAGAAVAPAPIPRVCSRSVMVLPRNEGIANRIESSVPLAQIRMETEEGPRAGSLPENRSPGSRPLPVRRARRNGRSSQAGDGAIARLDLNDRRARQTDAARHLFLPHPAGPPAPTATDEPVPWR